MIPIFGIGGLVIVTLIAWASNRAYKKSLSRKLGRDVKDHEVTSLSAWMKDPEKK